MSFSFIKKKQPTSTTNNVNMQYDFDSKAKNQDTFNGAPAQPAQSFNIPEPKLNPMNNNPPQPKKGFGFIKKKNISNKAINNNLEKSNTSINSNDPKFSGINNNQNNNNFPNDLDSLINNTNDLLNLGRLDNNNTSNNNDNLDNTNNNLNTLGEY